MLAVVGDRFPRTGAVAMSIMGGIGMLSVGQLGGPGLGYAKDRFTAEHMQENGHGEVLLANKAEKPSKWLSFAEVTALDGKKVGEAKHLEPAKRTPDQQAMVAGEIGGSRKTLLYDALLPCGMGVVYLLLLLYFKSIGGYRPVKIEEQSA
jgi:hypothetical protein